MAQLHHSRNYDNRQNLMTAPAFDASEENSVKSAKQERALPRFHFLDNNGDELAEHCWPPKDRRCKRLTDPLLPFQPTCETSASLSIVCSHVILQNAWFQRCILTMKTLGSERHKVQKNHLTLPFRLKDRGHKRFSPTLHSLVSPRSEKSQPWL